MKSYSESGNISKSAQHSGLSRNTAKRYINDGYPIENAARDWRTRKDPFEDFWPSIESRLESFVKGNRLNITAKEFFLRLCEEYPDKLDLSQLRSFQRRVKVWKKANNLEGPTEIYFEQIHHPGRLLSLDWFHCNTLEVYIGGERFAHLICHCTLTYSNWEWCSVCRSESFLSLKRTLQCALFELGHIPCILQTDNSSTATHRLNRKERKRGINQKLEDLLDYYGMTHQAINIGKGNENGDIESQNGHFRKYISDHLELRGHSNFASVEEYEQWLLSLIKKRNEPRAAKLADEIVSMRKLSHQRLADYEEQSCRVNKYGLACIGKGTYSLPASCRNNAFLKARVYESRIEIWNDKACLCRFQTNPNVGGARIDYRHLLVDLLRKPGAFARYRYQEAFIPGLIWRECYDFLLRNHSESRAGKEYLSLLGLSLEHPLETVEQALFSVYGQGDISLDLVKIELGVLKKANDYKDLVGDVDLSIYDRTLLVGGCHE